MADAVTMIDLGKATSELMSAFDGLDFDWTQQNFNFDATCELLLITVLSFKTDF